MINAGDSQLILKWSKNHPGNHYLKIVILLVASTVVSAVASAVALTVVSAVESAVASTATASLAIAK